MGKTIIPVLAAAFVSVSALYVCAQTPSSTVQKPSVKKEVPPVKAKTGQPVQKTQGRPEPARKDQGGPAAAAAVPAAPVMNPFDAAVEKLASKEAGVRRQGADYMAQSRDQKAKPFLIQALKDESPQVRIAAVDGLGMLSARETVPQLSELLASDKEAVVRQAAAISLSYIMDPAAGPALIKALEDLSPAVKYAAAHTLGAMKHQPAEDPLILMLDSEDVGTRRVAVAALGDLQSKKAAPAMRKMFLDADRYTRLEAIRAIGNIGDTAAIEELKNSLDAKEDPSVRAEAALALSKMDDKSGLELAHEFVKSGDFSLKNQALNVIANIGDKRSLKLLEELFTAETDKAAKNRLDFIIQRLAERLKAQKQDK